MRHLASLGVNWMTLEPMVVSSSPQWPRAWVCINGALQCSFVTFSGELCGSIAILLWRRIVADSGCHLAVRSLVHACVFANFLLPGITLLATDVGEVMVGLPLLSDVSSTCSWPWRFRLLFPCLQTCLADRQTQERAPSYNMAENPRCIAEDNSHVLGGGKTDRPGSRSMEGNNDTPMFLMERRGKMMMVMNGLG